MTKKERQRRVRSTLRQAAGLPPVTHIRAASDDGPLPDFYDYVIELHDFKHRPLFTTEEKKSGTGSGGRR